MSTRRPRQRIWVIGSRIPNCQLDYLAMQTRMKRWVAILDGAGRLPVSTLGPPIVRSAARKRLLGVRPTASNPQTQNATGMMLFMGDLRPCGLYPNQNGRGPPRARLWENAAACPRFGSCHEKPVPGRAFEHLVKELSTILLSRTACLGCRVNMVEKCGDHRIDSPQALNYNSRNLLLLQTGGRLH